MSVNVAILLWPSRHTRGILTLSEIQTQVREMAPGGTLVVPYYEWPLAELDTVTRDGSLAHEASFSVHVQTGVVYVARAREPGRVDVAALRKWVAEQHRVWEATCRST